MAVVSPAPATTQQVNPMALRKYRVQEIMASTSTITSTTGTNRSEIAEEPVKRVIEEKIYVAVGKTVKDCKSVLDWALHNSGEKRVCIIHVHQPAQMIPIMGGKFRVSSLKEEEVVAYREIERQEMYKMLDGYLSLCRQMGLRAEKLHKETECIEKGILELISEHGIRKLVMGAAADKRYSRNMADVKSKKAIAVRQQAPASCHIWFICKGHLIHTREGSSDVTNKEVGPLSQLEVSSSSQPCPNTKIGQPNHLRSLSVTPRPNNYVKLTNPAQDLFHRVKSVNFDGCGRKVMTTTSLDDIAGPSTLCSRSETEGSSDGCDVLLMRSISHDSVLSLCSPTGMVNVPLTPFVGPEGGDIGSELSALPQSKEDLCHSSPPSVLDESIEDPLYDQLERAMEAVNSKREAFEEAVRRAKAEKDAIEAIRRGKALESLYADESKQRRDIEEALVKEKEKFERIKSEREKIVEELRMALDQKGLLENQIAESDEVVKELEQKIISAVELLQNYKKEREELQMERDNALTQAEELKKSRAEASSMQMPQFFNEFSFSEIEEATKQSDPSLKIGEGGYGSVYKGLLRHTQVAIKMLNSHSLQGPSEFQQEVDILSKMRHPNLVTLVGACPEAWTLVYEYLPNGNLEDRLNCRDNSPPLSWQTRIRIATELCSVLIFLHSSKPHSIVHGDLKPPNILLDANFVSKLSDFGISRLLHKDEGSSEDSTKLCRTNPKGTFAYMDPEFLTSGELTSKSDIYSFGIILLRLLTGRPALGITKEVQYALEKGNLKTLLDPLAGDWPFVLADQLARLALRCCEMSRKSRPDLASDVWRVLEPMKASCGGSSCFQLGSEDHCQPPPYFVCPILQEVMQDPYVAADGFSYEAEALRVWLDGGHDTSPMTDLKLEHCNLVPNHALRSAIQEWLQQQ